MRKYILILFALMAIAGQAQISAILGDWRTVDDKTGEKRSIVTIYKGSDGLYYGKISKMLMYTDLDLKCDQCKGEDYNAPIVGLVIIRGMKAEKGELVGGKVLDPESGKFYYGRYTSRTANSCCVVRSTSAGSWGAIKHGFDETGFCFK